MQWVDCQNQTQGSFTDRRKVTNYIVVHHAAALYPQKTGIEDVMAVHRYHLSKGWSGIGYHMALAEFTQGGEVAGYRTSDPDLVRAQVAWRNGESVGVSALTNFGQDVPAPKWLEALAAAVADLKLRYPRAVVVGHKEIAYDAQHSPDGKNWTTLCPGSQWPRWKPQLLSRVDQILNVIGRVTYTPDSLLLKTSKLDPRATIAMLAQQENRVYDIVGIGTIITAYREQATELGLDWVLAVAQMLHETGYLTSFWSRRPQRNPAGLGVTGVSQKVKPDDARIWAYNPDRKQWEIGLSFADWVKESIPAHLGRLLAYALHEGEGTQQQQQAIRKALTVRDLPVPLRGSAPTLNGLEGTWASPGTTYADSLAAVANRLVRL